MTDLVNHPPHYFAENGMEALDVIDAFFHDNYYLGNVFKYIARAGKKGNELQDLQKAQVYLEREMIRVCGQVPQRVLFAPSDGVPRVWDRFQDVPIDVRVTDIDGDVWYFEEGWRYTGEHRPFRDWHLKNDPIDGLAPLTEVLDD